MNYSEDSIFARNHLLLGKRACTDISAARVAVFGVGGVGSWCAEGLVRAGVKHLMLVDFDCVSVTNINRQLMATCSNVGKPKVEALRERLMDINPYAEIICVHKAYNEDTAEEFDLNSFDFIIDAIDQLKDKIKLILDACNSNAVFFSSMGAALKVDPTRVKVADFWKVRDCPLGAALRKRMRQRKTLPAHSFQCVYSGEVRANEGASLFAGDCLQSEAAAGGKAVVNGSLAHITAIFGMTLCGLVLQEILDKK